MRPTVCRIAALLVMLGLATSSFAQEPQAAPAGQAPFNYVWGKAFHILPETHSDESGYFSLCEGRNGRIYVGTAKYNVNAFLVEFDPQTQQQRIAIDVNKVCHLTATGYAAQSKIHTRNFVGPSGKIYVGSKQGYRSKGDTSEYPGGYVIVYDPTTDTSENLGMPYPGQGVTDVVADEARGLLYVITCEDEHWMLYDVASKTYRELGPRAAKYGATLMDAHGRAHILTADSQLATYDPETDKLTLRPIDIGGEAIMGGDGKIPTWQIAADGRTAYLIRMSEPTLFEFDLWDDASVVKPTNHGPMLGGSGHDSRSSMTIGPDGRVYMLIRTNNETRFGKGYLHNLVRFDPATKLPENLGVLAVRNPDFFDFSPDANGKRPPWSHGYHTLPDGALTPLHAHMGLIATRDGTLYATIIYPYTLLQLELKAQRP